MNLPAELRCAMVMRRLMVILVLACLCLGCESKPNQIEFIIPVGFRGTFAVKPDASDGVVLAKGKSRYVLRIPESGVLLISGYDPFHPYLNTAKFANDDQIWVAKRIDDRPKMGQVALFSEGLSIRTDENKKQVAEYRWFVGTEEERKNSSKD